MLFLDTLVHSLKPLRDVIQLLILCLKVHL